MMHIDGEAKNVNCTSGEQRPLYNTCLQLPNRAVFPTRKEEMYISFKSFSIITGIDMSCSEQRDITIDSF